MDNPYEPPVEASSNSDPLPLAQPFLQLAVFGIGMFLGLVLLLSVILVARILISPSIGGN